MRFKWERQWGGGDDLLPQSLSCEVGNCQIERAISLTGPIDSIWAISVWAEGKSMGEIVWILGHLNYDAETNRHGWAKSRIDIRTFLEYWRFK